MLHKPTTPSQMALLVCGLTAAPCPHWYEHRQSCPGVTQAVLYVHRFIHSTRRWSRLAGNKQVLALPFSTQIPDRAVSHTFVQPIDCLMSNPYPGDTNWIPGNSGWREGVTAPPLPGLVPVPGCLLGSEPATCLRTPPASRRFTPASPLLVPVGSCALTVSDHELSRQQLVDLCTGKRPPVPPELRAPWANMCSKSSSRTGNTACTCR